MEPAERGQNAADEAAAKLLGILRLHAHCARYGGTSALNGKCFYFGAAIPRKIRPRLGDFILGMSCVDVADMALDIAA